MVYVIFSKLGRGFLLEANLTYNLDFAISCIRNQNIGL